MEQGNEAAETDPGMDTTTAMKVLAHTSSPIEVGEIEFDEDGGARPRLTDAPVSFRFRYYGVPFDATMPVGDDGRLHLTATLGVIPFSLENSFGRKAARAIIRRAHMPNGRLRVDEQSCVHLEMTGNPAKPRTPVNVLSTVAALLMEAKPYLELLEVSLSRGRRRSRRPLA